MSPAPGPTARLRPPEKCTGCGVARVAWVRPRVDYCYACLPGGPFTPPPCSRCGSTAYFSQGLCERCHPGSPEYLGACKDCLAWGVYRRHNWRCWQCRWWQGHYPLGDCAWCGRHVPIGENRARSLPFSSTSKRSRFRCAIAGENWSCAGYRAGAAHRHDGHDPSAGLLKWRWLSLSGGIANWNPSPVAVIIAI